MYAIELKDITKKYDDKVIFDKYSLKIKEGNFVGIKGQSGQGKSTLLNIMGLLENYQGTLLINGEKISYDDKKQRKRILKNDIGYLFQNYALIDDLSVYENLKIVVQEKNKNKQRKVITLALEKVGFKEEFLDKKIYTCSGGEQQRIAIARLMLKNCRIILADEPTGSLDKNNLYIVMNLLLDLHKEGKTIVMVSHDDEALSYADEVIEL
ncbi:MAG: ATP-binding cassette domain-containing protein [Lachnospiraceae bacterium]|nr:ATP-binding cassette domain-containing protein [Lachnospiraceae bacterium]